MQRIAIVGMGRSGTTYITEFLGKCGVFLDEVNWAQEHELARLVNDTALERELGARKGLPYGKLPSSEIELSDYWRMLANFFIRFMDTQAQSRGGARYWAFKDPRTTILHSIWLDPFDIIIGMFRDPAEVVASYLGQRWVGGWFKQCTALNYWKRFNQSLLHIHNTFKDKKQVFILDYNDEIAEQSAALCGKLGLTVTPEARALFKSSLNHYRGGTSVGGGANELHKALLEIRTVKT